MSASGSSRGMAVSLLASALFGGIFYLAGLLSSSAEVVFAWRVLMTFFCYLGALAHPAARRALAMLLRRLRARWWMPLLTLLLATIVGVQLWLFQWAPMHHHALDTSLGYLLLPICLVLGGRFLMGAHVSWVQWLVVALAALAVAVKLAATPQLSWVTLIVCIPYTIYFVLRQRFGLDAPIVFGVETALMLPVAMLFLVTAAPGPLPASELAGLIGIGLAGAVAMMLYLAASSMLSMPEFGLLGYVEPVLLVVVALVLGEQMQGADGLVYGILGVALTVLAIDGFRRGRRPGKSSRRTARFANPSGSAPGERHRAQ